jgi:hypothetical protein
MWASNTSAITLPTLDQLKQMVNSVPTKTMEIRMFETLLTTESTHLQTLLEHHQGKTAVAIYAKTQHLTKLIYPIFLLADVIMGSVDKPLPEGSAQGGAFRMPTEPLYPSIWRSVASAAQSRNTEVLNEYKRALKLAFTLLTPARTSDALEAAGRREERFWMGHIQSCVLDLVQTALTSMHIATPYRVNEALFEWYKRVQRIKEDTLSDAEKTPRREFVDKIDVDALVKAMLKDLDQRTLKDVDQGYKSSLTLRQFDTDAFETAWVGANLIKSYPADPLDPSVTSELDDFITTLLEVVVLPPLDAASGQPMQGLQHTIAEELVSHRQRLQWSSTMAALHALGFNTIGQDRRLMDRLPDAFMAFRSSNGTTYYGFGVDNWRQYAAMKTLDNLLIHMMLNKEAWTDATPLTEQPTTASDAERRQNLQQNFQQPKGLKESIKPGEHGSLVDVKNGTEVGRFNLIPTEFVVFSFTYDYALLGRLLIHNMQQRET